MAIYEKFVGAKREDFLSLADAQRNYKLTWNEDFNFAYDVVDELARTKPDKLAMIWVGADGEEKRFTFKDMSRESNRAANYFKYLGIRKGDIVLLVLRRSYYFWFCLLGLHKIGAVAVSATDMLKAKDYVYRCNMAGIKYAIITGHGDAAESFEERASEYTTIKKKLVTMHKKPGPDWIDFEEGFAAADTDWVRPTGDHGTKADDTMLLAFTSGTSGYPKMLTHDFRYPLGHIMTALFWQQVVDGGLHFSISDTGWLKAYWGKIYGQWLGESAVFVYDFERFDPEDILSKLEKYKITTFCVPPTMYRMMLQHDVKKYDLSSLTHCCTAGEALNPEIYNKWLEATGLKLYEGFGQSETTVCIATIKPWMEPVPGAIGLPIPGMDIHILNENNERCQRGTTGEICIRVLSQERRPCGLMRTYNMSEEDTDKAIHDGFYHTGDTAYRDEDGLFRYVGRNDDVIKSSGYRIGPFEIESVLMEHPAVLEIAVTGVPDAVRGFNVKATIVLQKGYEPSEALVKELQNYVKVNTAPYKYPRIVEFVESLPKTFNGKIQRNVIRQNDIEKASK